MSKTKRFLLAAATATLLAASGANAASVLGDQFEVGAVVDGNPGSSTGTGIAATGAAPREDPPNAAAINGFTEFAIWWVDGDSFDLVIRASLEAPAAEYLGEAVITLSDLDFSHGGQAAAIVGASFNEAASDYTGYLASGDNPGGSPRPGGPWISVTDDSVTITFTDFSAQLVGDQPIMRFDVQAVPEPGVVLLMLLGIGVLGLAGRRAAARVA